jgi:tetratricopeptide (TPR) repeat protein
MADCHRSLEINSNFYLTHLTLATSEILSGKYLDGEKRLNSFVRLTTIDRQYPYYLSLIGLARFLSGDEEKALEFAKEAYDRMPTTPWYALVYAATAGSFKSVVETNQFRQMVSELGLPKSHFRKLPFAIEEDIAKLERNLVSAGVSV